MKVDGDRLLAALWGFAEATLFFIVPDVLLSWLALRSPRSAFLGCVYALAGALVGGAAMWLWGTLDAHNARLAIAWLPGIDAGMIADVREQIAGHGIHALFFGPLRGVPYKIYAVEAASLGHGLAGFLVVSIPARMIRFLLVAALVAATAHKLRKATSLRTLQRVHLGGWIVFYAWYFSVMP